MKTCFNVPWMKTKKMSGLQTLISDIINCKGEICTLCFKNLDGDAFDIEDEVILKDGACVFLSEIILSLLVFSGENTVITTKVCEDCARAAVTSYTFIEKCKNSRKLLSIVLENLTDCVFDATIEKTSINSMYVTIDSTATHCKKYYDKHYTGKKSTVSKALKRFKILSKSKVQKVRKKKQVKVGKVVARLNDFSDNDDIHIDNAIESVVHSKVVFCEACPSKFPNSKQLRAHYVRVHAPKIHKCTECSRTFGAKYLLKLHESESHIAAICAVCGKTYSNIHSLKMHSVSHAKLSCPICNRQYKTRNSYRKHVKSKICTKEVGTKRMNVVKNYTCDICSKSFAHKGTLQVHINFLHGNGKSFVCSWCNKRFPAQSRLKLHIVKHTKERNFTCDVCGDKFVTKEALLYHTRIHTGETPYECPHCDMRFLSASRRMDHVRRKHMGPTLECDVCTNKFRTPCALKKHKKRHFNPNSRLFHQSLPESVGM